MAVYFEVLRRLRRKPELMKELQARGGEGRDAQVGAFRSDVKLEDVVIFVNIVANGMALVRSLGLELDADVLPKLVHGRLARSSIARRPCATSPSSSPRRAPPALRQS